MTGIMSVVRQMYLCPSPLNYTRRTTIRHFPGRNALSLSLVDLKIGRKSINRHHHHNEIERGLHNKVISGIATVKCVKIKQMSSKNALVQATVQEGLQTLPGGTYKKPLMNITIDTKRDRE